MNNSTSVYLIYSGDKLVAIYTSIQAALNDFRTWKNVKIMAMKLNELGAEQVLMAESK